MKSRNIVYSAATVAVALVLIACASKTPTDGKPVQQPGNTAPAKVAGYMPKPADFTLTVKTLEKHCFGSAGCNVKFRIEVAYAGQPLDETKSFDVTFDVKGAKDPFTGTFQVKGGQYFGVEDELVQTGSNPSLTAVVTAVS